MILAEILLPLGNQTIPLELVVRVTFPFSPACESLFVLHVNTLTTK